MNFRKNIINRKDLSSKSFFVISLISLSFLTLGVFIQTVQGDHDTLTIPLELGMNEVSFRDIDNTGPQTSSLDVDSSTVKAGFITVTVTDSEADLDLNGIDSVTAFGNVTTISGSSKTVVPILLLETGTSTQTFTGEAELVIGAASGINEIPLLSGDKLEVNYIPEPDHVGRFFATINVDSVSGTSAELSDIIIENAAQVPCEFTLVTNPVRLKLNGATSDSITVTMSYANGPATPGTGAFDYQMLYAPFVEGEVTYDFETLTPIEIPAPVFFGILDLSGHRDWSRNPLTFPVDPTMTNTGAPTKSQITNVLQPPDVEGLYALGYKDNVCPGGGGGGLVRPGLVVNVLAGSGSVIALFSGGSGGGAHPTFGDASLMVLADSSEGFGGIISNPDENSLDSKQVVEIGETVVLRFNLYENQGITNLERFRLFLNFEGENYDASSIDTHLTYSRGGHHSLVDPHEKIESAEVEILEIDPWNLIVNVKLVFKNQMKTSILVESWDLDRNSGKKLFSDSLEVVVPSILLADEQKDLDLPKNSLISSEATVETELTEIPVWVKNNAFWWKQKQIDDSDFIAGIKYLIKNAIIESDGNKLSNNISQTEIPGWIRDVAGLWADDSITDEEFINEMQWLVNNGILEVQK